MVAGWCGGSDGRQTAAAEAFNSIQPIETAFHTRTYLRNMVDADATVACCPRWPACRLLQIKAGLGMSLLAARRRLRLFG